MKMGLKARLACTAALAVGIAGCGGSGESRPEPTPPPPVDSPTSGPAPAPKPEPAPAPAPAPAPIRAINYNTLEYQRSNAAAAASAITAYEAGTTGRGTKLAVIDTGINPDLREFSGRIDAASRDVAGDRPLSDEDGHGTAVTAVAAAAKDDVGIHGVAFNTTIVSLRADSPGSCATTGDEGGCTFSGSAIAKGVDAARLAGATVINLSLGGNSAPSSTLLASINRAVSTGIVVVISAGNDGQSPEGKDPSKFALVPAQTFPGMVLIAGSIGAPDGLGGTDLDQISTFSNRAGVGAQYYLSALGYRVRAFDETGTHYAWSGTSFSAPVISGAVALLAEAFPHLTGKQIVEILFQSADDLGAVGTDEIFGRGRLNLGRAFQPIGTTSLAGTQQTIDPTEISDLPLAAGDSGGAGTMGAVVLDGYKRAFAINFARTFRSSRQPQPLRRALQGAVQLADVSAGPISVSMSIFERADAPQKFAIKDANIGPDDTRRARLIAGSAIVRLDQKTSVAFGFSEGARALEKRLSRAEAGSFLIARDVVGNAGFEANRDSSFALRRDLGLVHVTMSTEGGRVWQEIEAGAADAPYNWSRISLDNRFGATWLSASVGQLEENRTVLGGRIGRNLGGGGSTSRFLDVAVQQNLGSGFRAGLTARRGWTDFSAGSFATGAYSFDLTKLGLFGDDDRIGLRISQPLRVENGGFSLLLPTAYDYATGEATSSLVRYSLSPSGREIDAEVGYGTGVFRKNGWLNANLFIRREPGHIEGTSADYGGTIRLALGF